MQMLLINLSVAPTDWLAVTLSKLIFVPGTILDF